MNNPLEANRVAAATMSHLLTITFFVLAPIVGMTNCVAAYGDDSAFRITTKRVDDKVEVTVENEKTTISVQSPFGIGQAIIERSGNKWLNTVMLRLQLKGLEKFKITNGKDTLEAALSSPNGIVRLWKDGKEDQSLNAKSPYWMEIRMVSKDGKPVKTIPLKDGYFEMQLPYALLDDNPKSLTLTWVDFYR